jgi:RNA polymerase sigma-70 factor (ECF subfamily)
MKRMTEAAEAPRRLLALLEPIHEQARRTARRLCRSDADGDDLFQEAALRALGRLHDLRDQERFRSWFFAVLLSVHRGRHRFDLWRRLVPLEDVLARGEEPAGCDGADWEEARFRAARVRRALATLPAAAREAIVLCDLEGFSLEEIASTQGDSVAAVKTRLSRARRRLRRYYQKLGSAGAELLIERGGAG